MTPRENVTEAMKWANEQIIQSTTGWTNQCQRFSRTVWGMPAFAPSALKAWDVVADRYKVKRTPLADAPRGAILIFAMGQYGHACIASTRGKCISTDYVRRDMVNQAPRGLPSWNGKGTYLGYMIGAQFYDLNGGFFVGVGEFGE